MAVTTHQSHNIPWQLLAHQLWAEEVVLNGRVMTRLRFKREDASETKLFVHHFARKFASTICEFSDTEAKKKKYSTCDYSKTMQDDPMTENLAFENHKVYPDSICGRSTILRVGKYQDLGYWRHRFEGNLNGDLADVIKELFNLDMLDSVLYLVRNGIQLHKLAHITYSNFFHYGIRCTLETCLMLYLVFNVFLAMDLLKGEYKDWPCMVQSLVTNLLQGHDYDADLQVPVEWLMLLGSDMEKFWAGWKSQMKFYFRCLYQYEVMSRELQRPVKWELEVKHVLGLLTWPCTYVSNHQEYAH